MRALPLAFAAAVLVALLPACKKKKTEEARPTAEQTASAAARDPATIARSKPAAARVPSSPRLALAQLTIEEVAPMVPEVKGGQPLGEPIGQAGGRQVRQSFCLPGADLDALGGEVQQAMTGRGFTASQPTSRGKEGRPRVVVSGQKDDLRLSANLIPSSNPECSGKAEVLYTFHRVVKRAPAGGDGAAPAPAEGAAPAGD
jgi:hypothetical protein